jgi:hypothetical protein
MVDVYRKKGNSQDGERDTLRDRTFVSERKSKMSRGNCLVSATDKFFIKIEVSEGGGETGVYLRFDFE